MSTSKNKVISIIPNSIDNAVTNIINQPTKNIGQTLSDCWYLAFGGISQLAEKRRIKYAIELEQFKKDIENSINNVPDDQYKEPSSQIILTALDDAKFCVEEKTLRDMFVELITSSTNKTKPVHPSFSSIIRQMNSLDAILLRDFKFCSQQPICNLTLKADNGFHLVISNLYIGCYEDISDVDKSLSISSLIRLGLLAISSDEFYSDENIYDNFKSTISYMNLLCKYPSSKIGLQKGIIRLTPLGASFVTCCIPD